MAVAPDTGGERVPSYDLVANVPCPFCGLLCDDLEIGRSGEALEVCNTGCPKAIAGFERPLARAEPTVRGQTVPLDQAIRSAAARIRDAQLPLFGGLATDVEGIRAAMSLAERSGGVVDHALSEAQYRNLSVLQSKGWITSTLTEVRNRADLVIIAGSDALKVNPRFFERIIGVKDRLFEHVAPKRTVVILGGKSDGSAKAAPIGETVTLPCPIGRVGEVLSTIRARLRGVPIAARDVAGVSLADIDALAERCRNAKYGVIVWAPPIFDFPHGDVTVEQITELVKDLNKTTRFAGLALGGSDGTTTAAAVSGWQSGFPLRISYATGAPNYDAFRFSIGRMLASGEGDLLVWIASFTPDLLPPPTGIPTMVLGLPEMKFWRPPAVFIPVGTPGMDHAGRLVRCDNVVSLLLRSVRPPRHPRVADVLAAIEASIVSRSSTC